MRCLLVALGLMGLVTDASAADYSPPILRGSDSFLPSTPKIFRWDGFYAGGQVSYGNSDVDFSNASDPQVAFALRSLTLVQAGISQWQVLGIADTSAAGFGGFVGYNTQFDDVVVGFELNYTRSSLNASSPSSPLGLNVTVSDGNYNVFSSANASLNFLDFAVLRGRAGWVIDNFLPYATVGMAIGRADASVSSTVIAQNTITPIPTPAPGCTLAPCVFASSQSKSSAFMYGYAVGGGLEVGLTPNIFARGEYEYISWAPLWQISAHMNITRLGFGLKF